MLQMYARNRGKKSTKLRNYIFFAYKLFHNTLYFSTLCKIIIAKINE